MNAKSLPIKTPLTARRMQHEADGKDYVHVEFEKTDGRGLGSLSLPISEFMQGPGLKGGLIDQGFGLPENSDDEKALIDAVRRSLPVSVGTLCVSTGWKKAKSGRAFLFPTGAVFDGEDDHSLAFAHDGKEASIAKSTRGFLHQWRYYVAGWLGDPTMRGWRC